MDQVHSAGGAVEPAGPGLNTSSEEDEGGEWWLLEPPGSESEENASSSTEFEIYSLDSSSSEEGEPGEWRDISKGDASLSVHSTSSNCETSASH